MSDRIKVLHVIPNLLVGGAQRLVLDICNELNARNDVVVKLLVFSPENKLKHLSAGLDITFCSVKFKISIFGEDDIDVEPYEKIVDEFKPDIIHSHLYLAEIVVHENARRGIAYFSHGHDNMIQFENLSVYTFTDKKKLTDYFERRRLFSNYADNLTFIAISKDTLAYFKKTVQKKYRKNIRLLHNAINVSRFKRNKPKIKSGPLTLVNVGNLLNKKNQTFFIEVVKSLTDKNIEVKAYIVGDGENRKSLEYKIQKLNLCEKVFMLGAIENVEEVLWKSDFYVHTALYEPFGLVLLEAMASELPIVTLNGGGNADIIQDGENGFILEDQNASVFAEKIIHLNNDNELQKKLIKNGLKCSKKFDIESYTNKLFNLYKSKL